MAEVAETLVWVAGEPGKERIAGFEPRISLISRMDAGIVLNRRK